MTLNNLYIKCLKSEKIESGSMYGQFLINSLRPGQGITIGNLLRRVLLSDLEGTTITAVRIAGVRDEFSIIPGIREDILEILLNLKGVVVKSTTPDVSFGRLRIKGPAVVTADSIQLPPNIEIINPNHYIATISTENILEIEFKFEHGTGYKLAGQTFCDKSEDFLQIDAIFMPIQKVDFKIENVYDNSSSVTERLFLDIWTNGSISPDDAISHASKFIIEFFNSLLENKITQNLDIIENSNSLTQLNPHINIAIEELQLSVRAYNCLKRAQINTIGDLLEYSPEKLQELKNFGRKSADEVFTTLKNKLGIVLK
jgi:DNA-directed RNA polymerase subunit alpha|uniref:DNA-directed RNA polymerase subunit alpha n=2 Tax=Chaetoceros TaxID=49237 RepID=A0A8F5GHN3_9STRA|nr:RNA polymerase alpha subunit [Chaetoceros gracilis]QXM17226.1 RNA polymerase subunit alpha [Chaetoceros muellerii]